ncbi:hypothetical protein [Borreliella burgdorferi]|uniref:Uncharacterized protein n=1 Tax=Borreliella burgdorferi (strain ATCC 35210 / DSM 4680 / CIP 102532 / B31) TaxID=224326 RepID=Q9S0A6_BORBU|nr:hypothetical protein [Borreliella burgdorferi]AAF07559.1 conserved hypothetical protein [Borreliella burgdorferi B31]MCR8876625.1 hypothetical protein [Borreliella burgdorferi]PRQ97173.1 hypothetical protein CV681_06310 [Borreliella burgdorferi]PRR04574.1 hypothetical protein CV664_06185 [Borreliella burgdorferi]PRR10713.1 hypothetical protein CV660_06270 [Borreliella burgdorferi]
MNQKQIFLLFLLFLKVTISFSYDQSQYKGYMEKYYHKKGKTDTHISFFQTLSADEGGFSTIFIGEDEQLSRLSFTTLKDIKDGKETSYMGFNLEYHYKAKFNNPYPMLNDIRANISKVKVKFFFDNGPEKIIRELNQKFVNNRVMWEIWNNSYNKLSEYIRINLRTSDPGIENLLPKLLKHKTVTITIEIPESEDPEKLTSSITFDLDSFQKLYKKYSTYFK